LVELRNEEKWKEMRDLSVVENCFNKKREERSLRLRID